MKTENSDRKVERAVTLVDIAKKFNVSTVTVSKALRDHPDISDKTKKLIKQAAQEMGYSPNLVARNLSSRKSNTIGLVVPKIAHYFFGSIIEHIYNIAFEYNYEILLMVSQENADLEKKQIQTLLSMKVDGIIISISQETKEYRIFDVVKGRGVPLVFLDRTPDIKNVNTVTVDDYGGAYKAVDYAIKLGYKKIGHFAGSSNINIGRLRCNGFYDAMKDNNLDVNSEWIIEDGFDEISGYNSFMKLYDADNLPDFIFTVTYPVALGIYKAAYETGINIPYDVDLICFGNAQMQKLLSPALSCVDQPTDLLAEQSMDLLLKNINNNDIRTTERKLIDTNLIIRDTCIQPGSEMNVA